MTRMVDTHERAWRTEIRYRRERLAERQWHKFIIKGASHDDVLLSIRDLYGPIMYMGLAYNGALVMLASEHDRIKFKLRWPESDRGYGWWNNHHYTNAKQNRIK